MTTPRLADRITALAGSADLSGFAPFFSPVMFFLNENHWAAMTLTASLAAILLIAFVAIGILGTATNCKAVPVNTRVRRVRLATLRQEFATFAWR